MSTVLNLLEELSKNTSAHSEMELIKALRAFHHSVHAEERSEAIEALGVIKNPEASRELIQLFSDCQWRSTKLQIIRVLANNPSPRSLEFLFRLAQENSDIPLAEAAIETLGRTHHVLAARFLVQLYRSGAISMKPFVVLALGHIPDRTLAEEFLEQLPAALEAQQTLLVKNLVLTLGDLKVKEALPILHKVAKHKQHRAVALSALMSLGKIARDYKLFDELEPYFKEDSFEYQIFTNARNQAQFRSEWKLEDYLQKLFSSDKFHASLLFELNSFVADDVKEGLKLFKEESNFERLCMALSKLEYSGVAKWYQEIFELDKLDNDQLARVLKSMSHHMHQDFAPILNSLKSRVLKSENTMLFTYWVEAVSLCLPNAEVEFKNFCSSSEYTNLSTELRVQTMNQFVNFALTIQNDSKRILTVSKILETLLTQETDIALQARTLRALGQIGVSGHNVVGFIKSKISIEPLTSSCLFFLEMCPDKQSLLILEGLFLKYNSKSLHSIALIKALIAQDEMSEKSKELTDFINSCLADKTNAELLRWALCYVSKHPSPDYKAAVLLNLKNKEHLVQLHAVIAIKSLCDESMADELDALLKSTSESIRGRALDALTSMPGNRAKRLVIDYLRDNVVDVEICDKIIRCFVPPEGPTEYFINVVSELIQKHPKHELYEGLVDLKEKLGAKIDQANSIRSLPKGTDITAIDRQLTADIPIYAQFDESVKTALRSAEVPFHRPEMFDVFVDKSSSVLGYSKAVDIILEKQLGRKILFPRLEGKLHEFQNVVHTTTLNEEYPSAERVIKQLALEKHFAPQSLPLHKMSIVSRGILNSKIVHEHFRVLDGLRAWAVVLLMFARKTPSSPKPLLPGFEDELATVQLVKKLMWLQDLRNPIAHRQTLVDFKTLEDVKAEVLKILASLEKMLF